MLEHIEKAKIFAADLNVTLNEIKHKWTEFQKDNTISRTWNSGYLGTTGKYSYNYKSNLTIQEFKLKIEEIRAQATQLREVSEKAMKDAATAVTSELAKVLKTEEYYTKGRKSLKREKTWLTALRTEIMSIQDMKNNITWKLIMAESHDRLTWLLEYEQVFNKAEAEKKANAEHIRQIEWAKNYMAENKVMTPEAIGLINGKALLEAALTHAKKAYSEENGITGEKCYCDAHDEARHSHFAEEHWNSAEGKFEFYETSETY